MRKIEFSYYTDSEIFPKMKWTYHPVGYNSSKPFSPEFETFMEAVEDAEDFGYRTFARASKTDVDQLHILELGVI